MTLPNLNAIKRNLWRYPALYKEVRRLKRAIIGSSPQLEIERRPEIAQIHEILASPESQYLMATKGNGPKVLCISLRGAWTTHTAWETVIALGLRLRGADVQFLTCGGALPGCGMGRIDSPPCVSCYHYFLNLVQPFKFPIRVARGMVPNGRVKKILQEIETTSWQDVYSYEYKGLNLGQIALPMVRWYLRRGRFIEDKQTLYVYQTFLKSSLIVTELCLNVLSRNSYDVIFCLNGEFFAEAIVHHLARERGIRFVAYERGYHPDSLFFRHDGPACKYVVDQYWERIASTPLTSEENRDLDEYIARRYRGVKGIGGLIFWPEIEQDEAAIKNTLGLDTGRPMAVLFTNTTFDSMTQNMDVVFQDMFHWIETVINYFINHPEWQLVIRVHPSEIRDTGRETQEPVAEWIEKIFPDLPDNIKIVQPDSTISSYTLMRMGQIGLVYTSLAGLEMALMGKPIIAAGKAHYRGKGFTNDPASPEEYIKKLESLFLKKSALSPDQIETARRYTYLFFFRSMIPFDLLSEPKRNDVILNFKSLADLMPGCNRSLDVICSGILAGEDFLL